MRLTLTLTKARVGLLAFALTVLSLSGIQPAQAVNLDAALTAGTWSTITTRYNDEYSVVKATKLNATTTSATLDVPANVPATPRLYLHGVVTNDGGVSTSIIQAPLAMSGFSVDSSGTTLLDVVSTTTALGGTLGGVNSSTPGISATLDTSTRALKVIGSNISTTEVLEVLVEYRLPVKYRWYRQF